MEEIRIKTDLALEAGESLGNIRHLQGVSLEEQRVKELDMTITNVTICSKNAARKLQKPMGTYLTMEIPGILDGEEDARMLMIKKIAEGIRRILPEPEVEKTILIAGLGNRDVTADALGPCVLEHINITRHILKEYGTLAYEEQKVHSVCGIIPGVMGKTGMESAEIIKGVIGLVKPDVLIVVDALAARSTKRLNRTIQITDTGIHPGSGVGNYRNELTKETLGIPVLSIGVPTVVNAMTIVKDALGERYEEMGMGELNAMYVTGKDIDTIIKVLSDIIAESLNMALNIGID